MTRLVVAAAEGNPGGAAADPARAEEQLTLVQARDKTRDSPNLAQRGAGADDAHTRRRPSAAKSSLEFFKGFLKNPREVGSVIPSSRFLTRRTLECGEVRVRA